MAFSPKGDTLAVVTIMDLCLWDTRTWQKKRTRPATADHFARVDYSADGQILIFSENARSAALLDANTLEALLPLPLWTHPVTLTADNSRLAVLVEGRRVQVWDLAAVRTRFRELGIDW